MAKFKDYFKVVTPRTGVTTVTDNQYIGDQGTYNNYTWYARLIQGSASRITRYREYDLMDNDVDIARSLDTIAEEIVGSDPNNDLPLLLEIQSDKDQHIPTSTVLTLRAALRYWSDIHEWKIRLFKVARVTIKYGDCFFIRQKHSQKWEYIHPKHVLGAIVDEYDVTKVNGWQIKRDIKVPNSPIHQQQIGHTGNFASEDAEIYSVDDVVWFSLNDDIGDQAPFGDSILRAVYRAQKQKEMLEDAIIIYRIQRAPERKAFYIDVGKMPPQRVKGYLEGIKNEIRQRKVPSFGGGVEQIDSVYNPLSMTEDFFFASRDGGKGTRVESLPGGCFAMDTRVPLLDGRELTIEEISREYKNKQLWTYSVDTQTGKIIPGKIDWAGVTHEEAEVIKLEFDNDTSVVCTPDHKFPVWGKGYMRADELTPTDSIISFEESYSDMLGKNKNIHRVYDHSSKTWKDTHELVRTYFDKWEGVERTNYPSSDIYHRDTNTLNNDPSNLAWLSSTTPTPECWFIKLIRQFVCMFDIPNVPIIDISTLPPIKQTTDINFCDDMIIIVRYLVDNGINTQQELINKLHDTVEFMSLWDALNSDHGTKIFKTYHLNQLLKAYGYQGWSDFKQQRTLLRFIMQAPDNKGRKVKSVTKLTEKIQVGTLTIDKKEEYHGHHNFALSNGMFTLNSNLGDLSDLEYFQWEVFRGLRIPLSFMRETQDNAIISDGKSGTAYIQELRFAMYIKRLQNYISKVLDAEFKKYLHSVGIQVDPSIFYIKLPEPENFGIYRYQQLHNDLLSTYSQANSVEHLSKRFTMQKYLQLSNEDILFNQRLRAEELGLDPDNLTKMDMLRIYGPLPEGGEMAGGLGGLGGMSAGGLGPSMGFGDMGGLGGEPGSLGGEAGTTSPETAPTGNNLGAAPETAPPI